MALPSSGKKPCRGVRATLTYKNNPAAKDVPRPSLDDLLVATEPLIREEGARLNQDQTNTTA
ncbi:hypothetical protein CBM2592_B100108 [Cupriavidus taiwanensis]|nr:hypothetical protein CBM2592_B100108 [Cupriavidus taiwanensis]SOY73909.1 hypothetical protein CBM2588_B90112 [Cupriavidus taiwanensis]SOY97893.1 hypothetical protein CBM2591_B80108 [Cupriavidus taiwanensis]SOZ67722.1 hypothetical protein CBM2617_B110109 [Cupriavidus taiwanensis]SOZ84813.1 hypothetical protein CBM2618_B110109 [Cupriavidus taiwanensis]